MPMSRPALIAWIEERRMDRFADDVVAAERERQVADAAADLHARAARLDDACRLDEIDGVVVVLFEAGGDREDVRIEDDVERIESRLDRRAAGRRAGRFPPCAAIVSA